MGLTEKAGPELRFGQDEQIRPKAPEGLPNGEGEIEGDEKEMVDIPHLFRGHLEARVGQGGQGDLASGPGRLELPDKALEGEDLSDRDGMDPDERAVRLAPEKAAAEALPEVEALTPHHLEPDEIKGDDHEVGQAEEDRVQDVHCAQNILEAGDNGKDPA
jgi:hypothetical protein